MAGEIYCGDNYEVLREFVKDSSVDLVYLDPPFNSQRNYHVVYKDSPALQSAFKDCWSWEEAAPAFASLLESVDIPKAIKPLLKALKELLADTDPDLLAYLTMMTPRLVAIHAALKSTGSMYLHCDPTASHYLKMLLDAIFGSHNFRNEIIWKRTNSHNSAKRYGPVHDVILFYAKSDATVCKSLVTEYSEKYLAKFSKRDEQGRAFQDVTLTGPGVRNGESGKPWRGYDPTDKNRHWAIAAYVYNKYKEVAGEDLTQYPLLKRLDKLDEVGLVYWTKNDVPRYKQLLEDAEGAPLQDVWVDIDPVNSQAEERTGYPTQKPLALLARILEASSNPGELVLDPFCGCGTTVEAAESSGRRWIGVDIARTAVEVIENRFKRVGFSQPEVTWHPADEQSAKELAKRSKLAFERWVLRKVKAVKDKKHDRGVDGESRYQDGSKGYHVVVSVKGGTVNPGMVRDLVGTVTRTKADIGVMVTLLPPSKEMRLEAAAADFLSVRDERGAIPRIQIVTVAQLFSELRPIRVPGENKTVMPKKSVPPVAGTQLSLDMPSRSGSANDNGANRTKARRTSMPGPRKTQPAPGAAKAKSTPPAKRRSSR